MRVVLLALEGAPPVVDIDGTLFVQGGLFLLLMFVLQGLLFKPWLAARERRAERIEGALHAATALRERAAGLARQYDERLARARDQALDQRNAERHAADAEVHELVAKAKREAAERVEQDRKGLESNVTNVRAELRGRVEDLAREVAQRVLGRAV